MARNGADDLQGCGARRLAQPSAGQFPLASQRNRTFTSTPSRSRPRLFEDLPFGLQPDDLALELREACGADKDPGRCVCDKPLSAVRDAKRSTPDYAVWLLKCGNAIYRISRASDMAASGFNSVVAKISIQGTARMTARKAAAVGGVTK